MQTLLNTNLRINKSEYITNPNQLNWKYLYTSGYWDTIIDFWISMHTRVIKDPKRLAEDYTVIESKLKSEKLHYDFSERVKQNLTTDNKQDFLKELKIN